MVRAARRRLERRTCVWQLFYGALFGIDRRALAAFYSLLSVATCAALFYIARRLTGSGWAGLAAAALLTISPIEGFLKHLVVARCQSDVVHRAGAGLVRMRIGTVATAGSEPWLVSFTRRDRRAGRGMADRRAAGGAISRRRQF